MGGSAGHSLGARSLKKALNYIPTSERGVLSPCERKVPVNVTVFVALKARFVGRMPPDAS